MIYVGIDDTDILGARGTNQLARCLVSAAADRWACRQIVRHQLLYDPRIPYTSKNGSASIVFESSDAACLMDLIELCRTVMQKEFIPGSDPGLCVTSCVPENITEFGWKCQREIVTQDLARLLANQHALHLEGLGGTEGGVIGALAAVGLAVTGEDGRIVQWGTWPDDLSGRQPFDVLQARGLTVKELDSGADVRRGTIDVGKHLRPNLRGGGAVLFVRRDTAATEAETFTAVKLH